MDGGLTGLWGCYLDRFQIDRAALPDALSDGGLAGLLAWANVASN